MPNAADAAAGFCLGNQVFTEQRHGQAGGLNGCHLGVAELGQVGQHMGGQWQSAEVCRKSIGSDGHALIIVT